MSEHTISTHASNGAIVSAFVPGIDSVKLSATGRVFTRDILDADGKLLPAYKSALNNAVYMHNKKGGFVDSAPATDKPATDKPATQTTTGRRPIKNVTVMYNNVTVAFYVKLGQNVSLVSFDPSNSTISGDLNAATVGVINAISEDWRAYSGRCPELDKNGAPISAGFTCRGIAAQTVDGAKSLALAAIKQEIVDAAIAGKMDVAATLAAEIATLDAAPAAASRRAAFLAKYPVSVVEPAKESVPASDPITAA